MNFTKKQILVFDCESLGLWGSAFAVGAIVLDVDTKKEIDRFELVCTQYLAKAKKNEWLVENVLPYIGDMPTCRYGKELRDAFFSFYEKHRENVEVWVDAGFPVETNFLAAVANDDIEKRAWIMPFPLRDVANYIPIDKNRGELASIKEMRQHHPTDDALASILALINEYEMPY